MRDVFQRMWKISNFLQTFSLNFWVNSLFTLLIVEYSSPFNNINDKYLEELKNIFTGFNFKIWRLTHQKSMKREYYFLMKNSIHKREKTFFWIDNMFWYQIFVFWKKLEIFSSKNIFKNFLFSLFLKHNCLITDNK